MDKSILADLLADLDDRRERAVSDTERVKVASAISVIEHMYEDDAA